MSTYIHVALLVLLSIFGFWTSDAIPQSRCNWVTTLEFSDLTPELVITPIGHKSVDFASTSDLKQLCLEYAKSLGM